MYRPEDNARLLLPEATRIVREAMRDKSYRAYPLGMEAGAYLRWKRGVITKATYRDYESCLDKLAREFPDLEIGAFEPPVGIDRLEEFLDKLWGDGAPRTYNKNHSILKDFFSWAVAKGKLQGNPVIPIKKHKKRDVYRSTFSEDARLRIYHDGPSENYPERDRIALRLLLDWGLRKGALRNLRYGDFDVSRRTLVIRTKGGKIRELRIVTEGIWRDLELAKLRHSAEPHHYFMPRMKAIWRGYSDDGSSRFEQKAYPDKQMGEHGAHDWWYKCLERAGVVAEGQRSGEKMHKARHTAGQRWLDAGENPKAVQRLLGHANIQTTLDVYTDWDADQLADSALRVLGDE